MLLLDSRCKGGVTHDCTWSAASVAAAAFLMTAASGVPAFGGPAPGAHLPLINPQVLLDLERELDDPAPALAFARDYVASWAGRSAKLAAAVERQDPEAALDAVLSIKNASAMVGAARLAQLAIELESVIRRQDMAAAAAALPLLQACGEQTVAALRSGYLAR